MDNLTAFPPTPCVDDDRPAARAAYVELSRRTTDLIDCYLRDLDPTWRGSIVLQRTTVQTMFALLSQFQARMGAREVALCLGVLQGALDREGEV